MRKILIACLLALAGSPVAAQMISRPTDAPTVSAVGQSWYELREPILYAGEAYYPAGAAVFFNANQMVRTGHFNGVPVYADATRDPYSVVYVPIGGGQLKPYERRRSGELAGSTGSTLPSFPVALRPDGPIELMAGRADEPAVLRRRDRRVHSRSDAAGRLRAGRVHRGSGVPLRTGGTARRAHRGGRAASH